MRITHRFDLLRPGRTIGYGAIALLAGLLGHELGPWGSVWAVGALMATGMVSVALPTAEAPQEAQEEVSAR